MKNEKEIATHSLIKIGMRSVFGCVVMQHVAGTSSNVYTLIAASRQFTLQLTAPKTTTETTENAHK